MNLSAFSFVLYPSLEPSMNINTSKVLTLYKMGTKLTLSKWECDKRIFSHLVIFFSQSLALQISKCIRAEFCPYYSLHKVKWNGEVVKIIIVKKFVLYVF